MNKQTKIGATSICRMCNQKIEYSGEYWQHIGITPRHPAAPTRINNTPEQPTSENATNEQMADVMEWDALGDGRYYNEEGDVGFSYSAPLDDYWNPIENLNHTALVEARLRELGLQMDYVMFLLGKYPGETLPTESERVFVATDFIDYHWWQITLDAQTRCNAAWAAYRAWKEDRNDE